MATTPTQPAESDSTAGLTPRDSDVWGDFAGELARLSRIARARDSVVEFWPEALRTAVRMLGAQGGAVWAPQPGGALRQVCLAAGGDRPRDAATRRAHERLLADAAAAETAQLVTPRHDAAHPPSQLVIAPVRTPIDAAAGRPAALLELSLPSDQAPAYYESAKRLADAVADVAAEHAALTELSCLRNAGCEQQRLLDFTTRVHGGLDPRRTAMTIAHEARELIGCDRASVLSFHSGAARLLAVSGVEQPERRSRAARGLERLARVCGTLGEPLLLSDDLEDAPPEVADALQRHADETGARRVIAFPMQTPGRDEASPQCVGVLVAEDFDAATPSASPTLVAEAARTAAPALNAAQAFAATPLARIWPQGRTQRRGLAWKLLAVLGGLAVAAAALLFVPAELRIEARGQVQPVVRRNLFAPRDAIVEQVAVEHGQQVEKGQLLATLRDPQLDLDIRRLDGEIAETRRRVDAVRATRTGAAQRSRDAAQRSRDTVEAYRLSAEEQELTQKLETMNDQRRHLELQRAELTITSPIDGQVVTWQVEHQLIGRPAQRGQEMMAVVDPAGAWRLELDLPDDRIGHLLAAQEENAGAPLRVEYRLGAREQGFDFGRVERIAQRAEEPETDRGAGAVRIIKVWVQPDADLRPLAESGELRTGASVRARVLCGQRSLGYVLLHDVIDTARVWWQF